MNKKLKFAIKIICFALIVVIIVGLINNLFRPKYYYNSSFPTTNTYEDFYKLEKNSVDVLFFGSSHAVCSFNPQVVYDEYGITSYNLGCEQQSLVVTYYWLREALKYQSPKVVILDTYTLHKYSDAYVYNKLNCSETAVRKALDPMRFSLLKIEAAKTISELDPTQSMLSYLLLNIRYHTRWKELLETDYNEAQMIDHGGMKGFTLFSYTLPDAEYEPFTDKEAQSAGSEAMVETAKTYLDKIVDVCNKNGIELILTKIPCHESMERYNSTKAYAKEHDLPFLDFNEAVLYNGIEYSATEDVLSHPNYHGAEKISSYLGWLLANEYHIEAREDASYDASRSLYEHKRDIYDLKDTTDIYEYLDRLNDENYSIFVFAPISYSAYIDDEIMNKMKALGFTCDLKSAEDKTHYCAVKDNDQIIEKFTKDDLHFSGSIRDGLTVYSFNIDTSIMKQKFRTYSMVIAGQECGNQENGITFTVFDNDMGTLIDTVTFDTTTSEMTATRN